MHSSDLKAKVLAEFFGTFLLILIGNGAIAVSVWTGAYGLWPVAFMWGLAVTFGVYASAAVSGAHINPAVTITMATFTDFEWRNVAPFIGAQIAGAFVASAAIHLSFSGIIEAFEAAEGLTRGEPGSQLSAMVYTVYAPNPAIVGTDAAALAQVSHVAWFLTEIVITAILLFAIFFLIDEDNEARPLSNIDALFIGLVVTAMVAYAAPVSMAALNPARDLGPRFWVLLAGWGEMAFPGPRGGFWIPTVSTILGGLLGGVVYHYVYKGVFTGKPEEEGRTSPEVVEKDPV